jgi:hypothetical protein
MTAPPDPHGPPPGEGDRKPTDPTDAGATPEDEQLLAELRQALGRADPVPAHVGALARSLLSWRHPEARLAELVADSRDLAGAVRGDSDVVLDFRAGAEGIVVQLSAAGDGLHRLVGQVEPAEAGTVEIRRPTGQTTVPADEWGRFVADGLPSGPISLRWSPGPGHGDPVETAWHLL